MARTARSAKPERRAAAEREPARPASTAETTHAAGPATGSAASGEPGSGPSTEAPTRACPTRTDGAAPLFQHRVTVPQCMAKQRKLYHKCFTCAHLMARG